MVYLPIGGAWLVASRLGIQPLGFGDTIVLLTAIHFHFAGFAAPLLAGFAGRAVRDRQTASQVVALAATGIILGTPLVAAGITFSPAVALVGAAIVSTWSVAARCDRSYPTSFHSHPQSLRKLYSSSRPCRVLQQWFWHVCMLTALLLIP